MTAAMAEPVTPPRGFPPAGDTEEFHPITARTVSDYTEVTCETCGPLPVAGTGPWQAVAHGADHAMTTGHTVTETHVRVTVILERG